MGLKLELESAKAQHAKVSKQLGTDIRTRGTINEASNMVIQERDKAIEARDTAIQARDNAIQARDKAEKRCDTAIQARDKAIQARDKANQEVEYVKNESEATKLWLMTRLRARTRVRKNIP